MYLEPAPDDTTLIRWAALIGPGTLEALNERAVELARTLRVTRGRKLRTDGTVVEANIHYPTDSSLLSDGVRVVGRLLRRVRAAVVAHGASVPRPKPFGQAAGEEHRGDGAPAWRRGEPRARVRTGGCWRSPRPAQGGANSWTRRPQGSGSSSSSYEGLIDRVVKQTRARVLEGRVCRLREGGEPVRAAYRDHQARQGEQADRVRAQGVARRRWRAGSSVATGCSWATHRTRGS